MRLGAVSYTHLDVYKRQVKLYQIQIKSTPMRKPQTEISEDTFAKETVQNTY